MRTPCEWTISEFVPRVKEQLVYELHAEGKNQTEISKLLGISQPRVSHYLNRRKQELGYQKQMIRPEDERQLNLINVQLNDVVNRTVSNILAEFKQNKSGPEAIPIICASCRELRTGSALCSIHLLEYPELKEHLGENKNCDMCLRWKTAPQNSKESLAYAESRMTTLKTLESLTNQLFTKLHFLDYIPQIGAQICIFNIESHEEHLRNVAGYPGRIIRYQNQAKIIARPEFYTSKTTAKLLLDLRKKIKFLTTILAIRNEKVDMLNLNEFKVFNTKEGDKIGFLKQLKDQSLNYKIRKIAILDSGSLGFEPIAYFLVEDPFDLLEIFTSKHSRFEK